MTNLNLYNSYGYPSLLFLILGSYVYFSKQKPCKNIGWLIKKIKLRAKNLAKITKSPFGIIALNIVLNSISVVILGFHYVLLEALFSYLMIIVCLRYNTYIIFRFIIDLVSEIENFGLWRIKVSSKDIHY